MFGKFLLFSILIIIWMTNSTFAGDPNERRSNVHSGNQIRTTFFNFGLIGRENAAEDFGLEWPINSGHFYIGDLSFMVGTQVTLPGGQVFESVEVADGPRGNNEVDPLNSTIFWGWEPLPGFANPNQSLIAMSHQPDSWPLHWQGWLGEPGFTGIAEQEGFFVVDDDADKEFSRNFGFLPDSSDTSRHGMGWKVRSRSFQFSDSLFQDALIFHYNILNEGTTLYPSIFFSMIVGTTIGGDGDTNDDNALYDLSENLIYCWDTDNLGNTGWSPVGYLGIALLETPGLDFDGIDNDGDGHSGSGAIIDASVVSPTVMHTGDPIVTIDYTNYNRTVTAMPAGGITITFNGQTYQFLPGDTLREIPNGIDDNLNGLIDELTEIPNDGIDNNGNGVTDEDNPHWGKKYIDYFNGNGSSNPMIEESKFDGLDNDGDWDVQIHDLGLDGIPNTGDFGEGDGMPTSGVGTGFPGEPHIDLTDPDEADEIGLTSFFYFEPFNRVKLFRDTQLWTLSNPGFIDAGVQNVDGDVLFGSGFFPSVPGDSQGVAVTMVMETDLNDLLESTRWVRGFYKENFRKSAFPVSASFPVPGSTLSGSVPVNLDAAGADPQVYFDIYLSPDYGDTFLKIADSLSNPATFNWQTTNYPDAIFNQLKVVASRNYRLSEISSDSVFTIDNPGNGAPQTRFAPPFPGDTLSGDVTLQRVGGDPEGDPTATSLFFSPDSGFSWQLIADNLPATGSFTWNTRPYPNTSLGLLKLQINDGQLQNEYILPQTLVLANTHSSLEDTLLVHRHGNADAGVTAHIANTAALTGHVYKLSFTPSPQSPTLYHVFDQTDSVFVLRNQPLLSNGINTSSVFDGLYLQIDDIENIEVNQVQTGWSDPQIYLPFMAKRFSHLFHEGIAYPSDYEVIFSDHAIDTSAAIQLLGLPTAVPTPVNFTIYNSTKHRQTVFDFWRFIHSSRELIALFEPDESDSLQLTWEISFDYSDSSNIVPPTLGDTLFVEIDEPLTAGDVYLFSDSAFAVGIPERDSPLPQQFSLRQNYPNPFNPETTIEFTMPQNARVKLEIYNILGQRVKTLTDKPYQPGVHRLRWNGRNERGLRVASGIYIIHIRAGAFVKSRRMVLLR